MRVNDKGILTFDKEEYDDVLKLAPKILKGRRGNSSRKKRIRMKLFRECIIQLLNEYIESNTSEWKYEYLAPVPGKDGK